MTIMMMPPGLARCDWMPGGRARGGSTARARAAHHRAATVVADHDDLRGDPARMPRVRPTGEGQRPQRAVPGQRLSMSKSSARRGGAAVAIGSVEQGSDRHFRRGDRRHVSPALVVVFAAEQPAVRPSMGVLGSYRGCKSPPTRRSSATHHRCADDQARRCQA